MLYIDIAEYKNLRQGTFSPKSLIFMNVLDDKYLIMSVKEKKISYLLAVLVAIISFSNPAILALSITSTTVP